MAIDDLSEWRLVPALTVYEIALLAKGYNPADHLELTQWPPKINRETYALIRSLQHAAVDKKLSFVFSAGSLPRQEVIVDWLNTKFSAASVREWIAKNGVVSEFFNPVADFIATDFSNTQNPHFAFKLAAAVRAWKHVSAHPETRRNKRPKTALKNWLEANADDLGLLKADGELNHSAIAEIATVANWEQKGGAPATNGVTTRTSPQLAGNLPEV